jgi:sulfite reductase (NADPH) flavoprotein alpha-component
MWTKSNAFNSSIISCKTLTPPESKKKTFHIVLNLEHSKIEYRPGDCIGVLPENSNSEVTNILNFLNVDRSSIIISPFDNSSLTIEEFLLKKANISQVNKKTFNLIAEKEPSILEHFNDKSNFKEAISNYRLWDFLSTYLTSSISLKEFYGTLSRLLPRLYSIASSPKVVGKEVHLLISLVQFNTNSHERFGICSNFLKTSSTTKEIPIYLQPTKDFLLPKDKNKDIIMIGPGTGIAPFLAFMQERGNEESIGRNWLFFGEWHQKEHFYYQDFWNSLVNKGKLQLETAFSRDQKEKIYVQDHLWTQREEIWSWLNNGAYFYVCGDASRMAKDVDLTLKKIVQEVGKQEPREYIKKMRSEHRYLRDIY